MAMPPYPIHCQRSGCERLATVKIAARWSDGVTEELKTYALCCDECLPDSFQRSRHKRASCRLAAGEILETPGIYQLNPGKRDRSLERRRDLEETLSRQ
jgi:hypothetical protein